MFVLGQTGPCLCLDPLRSLVGLTCRLPTLVAGDRVGGPVWALPSIRSLSSSVYGLLEGQRNWFMAMYDVDVHVWKFITSVFFVFCLFWGSVSIDQNHRGTGQHRGDPEVLQTV